MTSVLHKGAARAARAHGAESTRRPASGNPSMPWSVFDRGTIAVGRTTIGSTILGEVR
jgi:hypothetical protein